LANDSLATILIVGDGGVWISRPGQCILMAAGNGTVERHLLPSGGIGTGIGGNIIANDNFTIQCADCLHRDRDGVEVLILKMWFGEAMT
jgi:hypothetical protein